MQIKGTCAIITGGASGIGREVCKLLVQKGGKVIVADIDEVQGSKFCKELNETGKNSAFVKCNVLNLEDIKNCFKVATKEFGGAQIMFNNAGKNETEGVIRNAEKATELITLLFTSVVQGCILANEHFQEQYEKDNSKQFCIINTSSLSAVFPMASFAIYSLCKRSVMDCTRILSQLEWPNVRVNAIGPGFTRTNILKTDMGDATEAVESTFGLMKPEYIAKLMVELVEDDKINGVARIVTIKRIKDFGPLKVSHM